MAPDHEASDEAVPSPGDEAVPGPGDEDAPRRTRRDSTTRGFASIAKTLDRPLRAVLDRRARALGAVLADWPTVVGAALASRSAPIKLTNQRQGGGTGTVVLTVRVEPAFMLDFQYHTDTVIERIRDYLGSQQPIKLKLERGTVHRGPPKPLLPEPTPAHHSQAADMTRAIEDPALRDVLSGLGAYVLAANGHQRRR